VERITLSSCSFLGGLGIGSSLGADTMVSLVDSLLSEFLVDLEVLHAIGDRFLLASLDDLW